MSLYASQSQPKLSSILYSFKKATHRCGHVEIMRCGHVEVMRCGNVEVSRCGPVLYMYNSLIMKSNVKQCIKGELFF